MPDFSGPRSRFTLRLAQLLLVVGAGGLWLAARLPWMVIRSFDGLGQPKQVSVSGAAWSTALLPLAVLSMAAALAAVAVRGWSLRLLAVLMAAASFAAGYLAISTVVTDDGVARGADIAAVPVVSLLGGDRHIGGVLVTMVSAACMLAGAALLMRSAASGPSAAGRYLPPAARRSIARRSDAGSASSGLSERMIWDALDSGTDPTERPSGPAAEGR